MPSWHRPPPELPCFIIQQLLTTKYEVVPYISGSSWTPIGIYLLPQSKQQRHEAHSQAAKPRWVWHHFTQPAVPPSEPSPSFATANPSEYSLHSPIAPVFSTLWAEGAALIKAEQFWNIQLEMVNLRAPERQEFRMNCFARALLFK